MSGFSPRIASFRPALVTLLLTFLACSHLVSGVGSQQQPQQLQPARQPAGSRSPCPRAIKINTNYQYRGTLHFICLQLRANSRPRLDVIQYADQRLIWSREVDERDTSQLASFVDDKGTLRILLAVPHQVNGTSMYSLDASGRFLDEKHTINAQLVSTMAIWKLELNWEWHLAISNQPHVQPYTGDNLRNMRTTLPDAEPLITFYSWRYTYFDQYHSYVLPKDSYVNKLEPMHIYDQEFLIVALESPTQDIRSLILKLDYGDGQFDWVHSQDLSTKLALDASSFYVTHRASLQRDYYIALVGRLRPDDRSRFEAHYRHNQTANDEFANDHGLIIYKYFGKNFIKTNFLPVPGATKLDTITYGVGDSYVVVALMNGWSKQISLFLYDGLNINPLPGPAPPRGPVSLMPAAYSKHKRTLNTDGLHLFNMPPVLAQTDESTSKRTLSDDTGPAVPMPALAFSSLAEADSDYSLDNETEASETLYEIPVDAHIRDHDGKHDDVPGSGDNLSASHRKRNFINVGQDLLGWCKSRINTLLADGFESKAQQLAQLPRVDQPRPIEIHGDVIIEGDLHVSNLLYVNRIENQNLQRIQMEGALVNTSVTFNRIEQAHSTINLLKNQVEDILVADGTIQEVYTPLKFDKIILECSNSDNINPRVQPIPFLSTSACPQVAEIRTNFLNNRNISDIQRQALLTGRSMRVGYDVRFEHLVLHGRTRIEKTLNGIPISEIVFKRGQSTGPITGHKTLHNGLYSTANLMVGNWNGARVDSVTTLTSSGEQRIDANINFNHVVLDSDPARAYNLSSRIEILNGLHLDAHFDQIALADRSNDFQLPLVLDELIINGPTHFPPNSLISSVNIENLWASTMFKHSHQNVTAPMHFNGDVHVSYGGDINIDGLINGIYLRPQNVMMRNLNYSLPNPFVFEGDLIIRALEVNQGFNGIQVLKNTLTGHRELALLYNEGNQIISGDKIFNEIHLGGSNNIGTINGHLNLTQLYSLASNDGRPFRFKNVRLRSRDIRFANSARIHIESLINGIPVNDICSLATRLAQSPVSQFNRLRFEQPVVFKSLRCAAINGFNNLRNSFLMRQGNQRVAGTLRLINGATFNSTVEIVSTFNNLNIRPLAKAITQAINESRTGHKDFYGDVNIDSIEANRINDLALSSVFVANADRPQIITAPMSFDHLDIENVLVVGRELSTGSFNKLNVTDMMATTLQYDAPQVIYNHVELDHLHILPGANLITDSLNGHDLSKLYSDAVVRDLAQEIVAPKTFRGPVEFVDRVFLGFGIDGLSEGELKFNLLLQSDELIDDDLEFNNDVTIMKSLEIQTGIINDVDVNLFVNSMLYENRPNGLRVLGNSSLRFKDVQLNNLVVTGTIQGIDLSREAVQRGDNTNGSYDMDLRQQQIWNNNQQIFNRLYNSGTTFKVQTKNRNETYAGTCHIHSCPPTTPLIPISRTQNIPQQGQSLPMGVTRPMYSQPPQMMVTQPPPAPYSHAPWARPPPTIVAQQYYQKQQPQQQHYNIPAPVIVPQPPVARLPMMLQMPLNMVNTSVMIPQWHPKPVIPKPTHETMNTTSPLVERKDEVYALVDPRYLEHQARLKAEAIRDLIFRVNRYLSASFYYEIVQKHSLFGPVLHAADNPILNEEGSAWLLLKAANKKGEPCLPRGQTIEVMAQQRIKGLTPSFTVSSHIQETSSPHLVESVVAGKNHYLFIADLYPEANTEIMSHILIYLWDYRSGMYDIRQRIAIDGLPTRLKAFVVNQRACIAMANPRVLQSNHSGAPLLYCQQSPLSDFGHRIVLPLHNIFDLDIVSLGSSGQIVIAALAQQDTEQIGDLIVSKFDFNSNALSTFAGRRTARPLRLHFIKQMSSHIQLVVSEGVTSNEGIAATTRIYSLQLSGAQGPYLAETQIIRDYQFTDIQSVSLDASHSMVFLQSTHSISIYAPVGGHSGDPSCNTKFTLIQRLPLKGANKFLVFNNKLASGGQHASEPFGHMLVLSKDDCEHQQYSTIILKPKFV